MPQTKPNNYWRTIIKGHPWEEKKQIITRGILLTLERQNGIPISRGRLAERMGYNSGTAYNIGTRAFVVCALQDLENLNRIAYENNKICLTDEGRKFIKEFVNRLPDVDDLRKYGLSDIRQEIPKGTGIPKRQEHVIAERPMTLAEKIETLIMNSVGELNPDDGFKLSTDNLTINIWVKIPSINRNSQDGSMDTPASPAGETMPSISTTY